eukprot:GHVU01212112.1.p1 GENE.GHVU01212112.1~~GHVU01212112.1.p1  ORF type:complete len:146 (+),score=16.06 GHVU01212112.1:173-610(+)
MNIRAATRAVIITIHSSSRHTLRSPFVRSFVHTYNIQTYKHTYARIWKCVEERTEESVDGCRVLLRDHRGRHVEGGREHPESRAVDEDAETDEDGLREEAQPVEDHDPDVRSEEKGRRRNNQSINQWQRAVVWGKVEAEEGEEAR